MSTSQDDMMMVEETVAYMAARATPSAPTPGFTSTLAFRQAPSALSHPAAPLTAPAGNALASFDSLPPVENMMIPTRKYESAINELGDSVDRASTLARASTVTDDPGHRQLLTAAGMVRLDTDARFNNWRLEEEYKTLRGEVELFRNSMEKTQVHASALERLVAALTAEVGSPELKAGLQTMMAQVKEEVRQLDEKYLAKKRGSDWERHAKEDAL